ncbi:MAG: calcium-binding protein [Janthinobacterium lividum]
MANITGTSKKDVLNGTSAADLIHGKENDDVLNGLAGDDPLFGDAGNDTLDGGAGNDMLDGGIGFDLMKGGLGDDRYVVDHASDVITELADQGIDTVSTNLNNYELPSQVENLTLTGNANLNATGNALDNTIIGNSGKNQLHSGGGIDTLQGGAGDDTYFIDDRTDTILENANNGYDTVYVAEGYYNLGENLEALHSTETRSSLLNGNTLGNLIVGTQGDDTEINGKEGNDTLMGEGGRDYLVGGVGNDVLWGGADKDDLDGGSGQDILHGGTGPDSLASGAGSDALYGDDDNDYLLGGPDADLLDGGNGDDRLDGGLDADLLAGGAGSDVLEGDSGSDILYGDDGNDLLPGGADADLLAGGAGSDIYAIRTTTDSTVMHPDVITGFDGGDRIDFGPMAEHLFFSTTPNAANGVWTTEKTTFGIPTTSAYADTIGSDGIADMLVKLVGTRASTIDASDFVNLPSSQFSAPTANPGEGIKTTNEVGHVFSRDDFGFHDADNDAFVALSVSAFQGGGKLYYGDTLLGDTQTPTVISASDLDSGKLVYYREGITDSGGQASFSFTVKDDRIEAPNTSTMYSMHVDQHIDAGSLFGTEVQPDVLVKAFKPDAPATPLAAIFGVNHNSIVDKGDALYIGALYTESANLEPFSDAVLERIDEVTTFTDELQDEIEVETDYLDVKFAMIVAEDDVGNNEARFSDKLLLLPANPEVDNFSYYLYYDESASITRIFSERGTITTPFTEIMTTDNVDAVTHAELLDLYFS